MPVSSAIIYRKNISDWSNTGSVIYRNGKLDMVLFPGGYTTASGNMIFHYYTQDYLGNNRAVINGATGAIEQTVDYYPYGGVIADLGSPTTGRPYKFGGKELITANGLNEYDLGARQYYSAVPGFTKPDPMAEKYYWLSPYLYFGNDPVNAIDPIGMSTWTLDSSGYLTSYLEHDDYDEVIVNNDNNEQIGRWRGEYGGISKIPYPSGMNYRDESGDIPFARKIDRINSIQAKYSIFTPANKGNYIEFSSGSSVFDDAFDGFYNVLDDPEVIGSKTLKSK